MPEVARRVPSARLLVVGDGEDGPALMAYAESNGLKDRVLWTGRVPRREAIACFGAADVVVVPSLWEGFGLSAVEAMAFAKPVVASDVDGLREVIEDGVTGRLVPCGEVAMMTEALVAFLEDPGLRKAAGYRGRERVERFFCQDAFAERHRRLYFVSAGNAGSHGVQHDKSCVPQISKAAEAPERSQ